MVSLSSRQKQKLQERIAGDALRTLKTYSGFINFSSNDYLGFATHAGIRLHILQRLLQWEQQGSGGSRLLTGNHPAFEQTECLIAQFHRAETALFFGSGYEANVGLISSVVGKEDVVVYDTLVHASLREGIRLSGAAAYAFKHNDVNHLADRLEKLSGDIYVITESVFSMDGDLCPLKEIAALCEQFGARLVVDEAHATGVIGKRGEGLVAYYGLEEHVFARVHTFGKAIGASGAAILGSLELRSFLVNFCRPFIYTTAPSLAVPAAVEGAYLQLSQGEEVQVLQSVLQKADNLSLQTHTACLSTAIRTVRVVGNTACKKAALELQDAGYLVLPVLSPTVPAGEERLRICLNAGHNGQQIEGLWRQLKPYSR